MRRLDKAIRAKAARSLARFILMRFGEGALP